MNQVDIDIVPAQKIISPEAWLSDRPWIDEDDADVDAYVASLSHQPHYDLAKKLKMWRDSGYVIMEGAIDQNLIEEYLEDIATLIREFRSYEVPVEVRGTHLSSRDLLGFPEDMTGIKLNQMQCFSRAAARLSVSKDIADFLGHVFRAPPSVCQSLTFWRGSEQPIHIDYPYVRQQTKLSFVAASWIPLEDVHPDAGPLGYFPGGHKMDRSGFFDWGNGSIIHDEFSTRTPTEFAAYLTQQMLQWNVERKVFCPKRGDALIWHGNLPHEGTKVNNSNLTRKSYVTHYTSEETLPDWMRNFDNVGNPVGIFENGASSYSYKWFDNDRRLPSWDRS